MTGFADAWQRFEASLGLDRIPEPARSLVLDTHVVEQDVVLGDRQTAMKPIRESCRRGSTRRWPGSTCPVSPCSVDP